MNGAYASWKIFFVNPELYMANLHTGCKLLLLSHAFDALGCQVVGLRTDRCNPASQRAIEALGAKKGGVIRHHRARRDGTVCDTVIYSILATECST